MSNKLNQVIAIEKNTKARLYSEFNSIHKLSAKSELFNGFTKSYKKKDEEGEDFPPEKKKVIHNVNEVIKTATALLSEMWDNTATKDFANCFAVADLVIDGVTLIKGAPATYLLYLEKQVNDIRTFVEALPTLEESEDWNLDPNTDLYKTDAVQTHKTKKIQKVLTRAEATDKHPAQTEMITEDVVIGYWDTIKFSGAMPVPAKKSILARLAKFSSAVKCAREKANMTEAPAVDVGAAVFNYLFPN